MKKRMMLYFGSFNPIHNGHIALAEYVVEQNLCDQVALIVSPQSPYKEPDALAPEMDRFEMAELACAASRFPERIIPSAVEFLLPRPSYTVDTLRYLEETAGDRMQFSILMGEDQIDRLDGWKQLDRILRYPICVYPRRGAAVADDALQALAARGARITRLDDAPLQEFASTDIRERLARGEDVSAMLPPAVLDYIRQKGLWSPQRRIEELSVRIAAAPGDIGLLMSRGKLHYRMGAWGPALNDFNAVLRIDATHVEAAEYARMAQEILEFRYKDIYNP